MQYIVHNIYWAKHTVNINIIFLVFFLQSHTLHVFFVGYLLTGKCFSGRRTVSMFEGCPTVFSSGFSRSLLALSRG